MRAMRYRQQLPDKKSSQMKRGLEERLREHPELRERFEKMLDIVENDDAELRVLEQVRGLGRELLQGWAEEGAEKVERAWDNRQDFSRKEKKL